MKNRETAVKVLETLRRFSTLGAQIRTLKMFEEDGFGVLIKSKNVWAENAFFFDRGQWHIISLHVKFQKQLGGVESNLEELAVSIFALTARTSSLPIKGLSVKDISKGSNVDFSSELAAEAAEVAIHAECINALQLMSNDRLLRRRTRKLARESLAIIQNQRA